MPIPKPYLPAAALAGALALAGCGGAAGAVPAMAGPRAERLRR